MLDFDLWDRLLSKKRQKKFSRLLRAKADEDSVVNQAPVLPFDPALAMRGMWNLPERLAGDTRPMIESMIKLYLMLSGNMSVKVEDVLNYGAWGQLF